MGFFEAVLRDLANSGSQRDPVLVNCRLICQTFELCRLLALAPGDLQLAEAAFSGSGEEGLLMQQCCTEVGMLSTPKMGTCQRAERKLTLSLRACLGLGLSQLSLNVYVTPFTRLVETEYRRVRKRLAQKCCVPQFLLSASTPLSSLACLLRSFGCCWARGAVCSCCATPRHPCSMLVSAGRSTVVVEGKSGNHVSRAYKACSSFDLESQRVCGMKLCVC